LLADFVEVLPVTDALLALDASLGTEHDDQGDLVFPDHLPELQKRLLVGGLTGDETPRVEFSNKAANVIGVNILLEDRIV